MIFKIIELGVSAFLTALGIAGFAATKRTAKSPEATKKQKRNHRLFLALTVFAVWFLIGTLISWVSQKTAGLKVELEMFSPRTRLFGVSFAKTTVIMWVIIAVTLIFGLIFRFLIFPRFDPDRPRGFQNVMELSVEAMENFAKNTLGGYADELAPYMYSLAWFMILSAFSELLGCRPPTSDIVVTFAMGLITFLLINFYGIRKKGIGGRLKGMMTPTPVILPMKILSDIAVPVSLACRLFGNMLGGMIVMDLLKSVLGGYATGLPALAGIYFNLFHPVIQAYIFIILSMTFINEAIE